MNKIKIVYTSQDRDWSPCCDDRERVVARKTPLAYTEDELKAFSIQYQDRYGKSVERD